MVHASKNRTIAAMAVLGVSLAVAPVWATQDPGGFGGFLAKKPESMAKRPSAAYVDALRKTAAMVNDPMAQRLVNKYKLNLLNLTWEDTGRYKNSSVGPNISDMTIQVGLDKGRGQTEPVLMPVIRGDNFEDKTGEMDPRDFTLLVGNEDGRSLKRVSLYEFLLAPGRYLSDPSSWPARSKSLLASRDDKVLVSAQACFLPVPQSGKATFNPVLFNYQSSPGNPAVLTILATREGTSTTIIDNNRDGFGGWNWGQRLFHNNDGMRASLTGERMTDWINDGRPGQGNGEARVSDDALNMVLLIQVPLKHKEIRMFGGYGGDVTLAPSAGLPTKSEAKRSSDVENAVIGHGDEEGPFTEMAGLPVERDPRYPVRVTVQFYKATSNGVVTEGDVKQIKKDIERVYDVSSSVGSLVTGGQTGRITEYDGAKVQPRDWWQRFWTNYSSWSGESPAQARAKLSGLLGGDYMSRPVTELYLRDCLRS